MPLWDQFEKYVLKHNHRQGEDQIWADNLNNIRVADLPDEIVEKLIERVTREPLMNCRINTSFLYMFGIL